jgi:predicted site-specific integrase-resolvase
MEFITVNGADYIKIQSLAQALNVCTATIYNWQRAGHLNFVWPLGKALTFVSRETAERLMKLKITAAMGAFARSMEAAN